MKGIKLALRGLIMAVLLAAPFAAAHSTGHEARTAADCEKLPGTAKVGERAGCLACIGRAEKHHYHPDYPAGDRCRPDDGKP
jgi:hypothetical protein